MKIAYESWDKGRKGGRTMGRLTLVVALAVLAATVLAASGKAHDTRTSGTAHAPAACVDAIAQARSANAYTIKALTDIQPLFSMVPAAAKAGILQNTAQIYSIAAKLKRINAQIESIAHSVAPVIQRFNADAASCR